MSVQVESVSLIGIVWCVVFSVSVVVSVRLSVCVSRTLVVSKSVRHPLIN